MAACATSKTLMLAVGVLANEADMRARCASNTIIGKLRIQSNEHDVDTLPQVAVRRRGIRASRYDSSTLVARVVDACVETRRCARDLRLQGSIVHAGTLASNDAITIAEGQADQDIAKTSSSVRASPERFVRGVPQAPRLPTAVWINKPIADLSDQIEINSLN